MKTDSFTQFKKFLVSFITTKIIQLKSGRDRDFTCMTFGKRPYYIEHVSE